MKSIALVYDTFNYCTNKTTVWINNILGNNNKEKTLSH